MKTKNVQKVKISKPNQVFKIEDYGTYEVYLTQENASVSISGVFDVRDTEAADVSVLIHHQAKQTRAETTLKAVVRDSGFIRIFGRIVIDQKCGQTNSFLTERVLLLSEKAKAEAIPDLEIHTDDVKCSHAVSISSIPSEQLFYLMSRGISQSQAEDLIVAGFLG